MRTRRARTWKANWPGQAMAAAKWGISHEPSGPLTRTPDAERLLPVFPTGRLLSYRRQFSPMQSHPATPRPDVFPRRKNRDC